MNECSPALRPSPRTDGGVAGGDVACGRGRATFSAPDDDGRDDDTRPGESGPPALGNMIGGGSTMKRLFNLVGRLAASDATVLVRGETGSGKELVARTLHEQSRRANGPFVVFDCAAVPESLIAG